MNGSNKTYDAARNKAFADAAAGVIGSLVSMLAFYPVDVWKTSLQAEAANANDVASSGDTNNDDNDDLSSRKQLLQQVQSSALLSPKLQYLFRGLPHKIIHTIVSSFTYFYVYSLVQTKYSSYQQQMQHLRRHRGQHHIAKGEHVNSTSTVTKLLLTAFSAMMNTCITLPLDTISSRKQAGTSTARTNYIKTVAQNDNLEDAQCSSFLKDGESGEEYSSDAQNGKHQLEQQQCNAQDEHTPRCTQQLYISTPEKYKFSFSTNLPEEAFATSSNTVKNGGGGSSNSHQKLQSLLSLWNGLLPAMLLCTNPAIQYTMFDNLKNALFQHRYRENDTKEQQNTVQSDKLSMWEAFVFGLISKFCATIITYPLIRAKVLLMVSPPEAFEDDNKGIGNEYKNNGSKCNGSIKTPQTTKHPRSLPLLLLHIFRKDGVRGIYRGCSLQLLHTILKSALLMMVREKITFVSRQFFEVEDSN